MRRTRAAYHYAFRNVRRDEDRITSERIAGSLLNSSDRDFWSEIKRIRSNRAGSIKVVHGISDSVSISQLFADKYNKKAQLTQRERATAVHV